MEFTALFLAVAVAMLAAAVGVAFSARQVLLHIMPGDAGHGTALFGYHYYTSAFTALPRPIAPAPILLFDRPFEPGRRDTCGWLPDALARSAVWLVIGLNRAERGSTLLECGIAPAPKTPVVYELLKGGV